MCNRTKRILLTILLTENTTVLVKRFDVKIFLLLTFIENLLFTKLTLSNDWSTVIFLKLKFLCKRGFCVFALCFRFVFSFCVFVLCFRFVFSLCVFVLCFRFWFSLSVFVLKTPKCERGLS